MRPGQQNKRGRGRSGGGNNNNRKGQNPLSRTYDSSGPDVKIRGTAQTVADKYMSLARDAQSSGDRVMAENYLQHAEHYNRIIAAAQAQLQERHQRDDRDQSRDDDNDDNDNDGNSGNNDRFSSNQASNRSDDSSGNASDNSGDNNGNSGGSRRQSRQRQERQPFDPDAPQPVIEGVPAEVALDESGTGDSSEAKPRRRGRPRRAKAGEGEDGGKTAENSQAPEATAAE
ncbi:MAG: hypothetical protein CML29_08870 [Rhizobiales bacterium]|nr:hypothetical protein [Hyphomicrobiales bacterium]